MIEMNVPDEQISAAPIGQESRTPKDTDSITDLSEGPHGDALSGPARTDRQLSRA